jgi:CYTH domain-containing protein
MGIEIERKFLVQGDAWRRLAPGTLYRQGYIMSGAGRTVRVRIAGDQGFLTIKSKPEGIARSEFEYAIPLADAAELLDHLCDRPLIEKYRHKIAIDDLVWEVDEFLGDNQGLILAEVELEHADQAIALPDWIAQEVTQDARYYNSNLVKHPFSRW